MKLLRNPFCCRLQPQTLYSLPRMIHGSAVILMLVLLVSGSNAATIGWWRFEEGPAGAPATGAGAILDSSGNELNGTPANGPLYSTNLPVWAGAIGSTRSMQFNGYGTRIFVPDSPVLQLTQSLTIEASFKTEPLRPGTAPLGNIVMRGDALPGLDPYALTLNQGNIVTFLVQNESNDAAVLTYAVAFDTWTHAAGTLDNASGQMKLYVNGILVNSTITSIRPLALLNPEASPGLGIGCDQTGQYGEYLNGWLDEVRISDTALEPSQFLIGPACSPHRATATATLVNGFVVGAIVTDGGCGYTKPPYVLIQGGGGTGAQAISVLNGGVVVGITITNAGIGYTNAPNIYIYSPNGPQTAILKAVRPTFSDLIPGANYQLQMSTDFNNWTNQGAPFSSSGPTMAYPQYWDVENWNQLFFRVLPVP